MFSRLDLKEILKKKIEKERKEEEEQRKRLEIRNRKVNNSESNQTPSTSEAQHSQNNTTNNDDQFLNTHINNVSPISSTFPKYPRFIEPGKDRTFKRCVCTGSIALVILFCIGVVLGALAGSGGKFKFVDKYF